MSNETAVPVETRRKWLVDAVLLVGGLLASLSGIYFLYLPSGGYQGGRNPFYGITILFSRHTWEDVHTWGGLLMLAAVVVHLALHWRWIQVMSRRSIESLRSRGSGLPAFARFNVALNAVVGLSFLICTVSGLYFLWIPEGGYQGGTNPNWDPNLLFSRTTWDMIHTWSGVVMIATAVVHFAIHWRWIKSITAKLVRSLLPRTEAATVPAAGQPA